MEKHNKELNKIICSRIFDEIFDGTEFKNFEESKKFELLSAISVLNKNNLNFIIEDLNKNIVFGGGDDMGMDSLIIAVNKTIVNSLEDIDQISKNNKWNVELIVNQSKFTNKWSTNCLFKITANVSEFIENSQIFCNPVLVYKQEVFNRILELMPIDSSLDIEVNICNVGNSNEVKDNPNYLVTKNTCKDKLDKLPIKARSVNFNEFDFASITKNYKSKSIEKNIKIEQYFEDSFLSTDNSADACISLVSLTEYIKFISLDDNPDYSIFEDNVRDYQNETSINKDIINSFNEEREFDFWWLNNGVTILVDTFQKKVKLLVLKNPQIINGLQSSYSLYNALDKLKKSLNEEDFKIFLENENRKILLKVIKGDNEEKTNKIIRTSNTQNPMNYATLRANDSNLKTLENDLLSKDIFLERRKNYYRNRKISRNKIIATDYIAKTYDSVINKQPCIAKNRTIIYFRDDKMFKSIFNKKNRKILISVADVYYNVLNSLSGIEIQDNFFNEDNLSIIKTHFKYHIMSLYWMKFSNAEFSILDLKLIIIGLVNVLKKYKDEIEPNLIEKIIKVSTYVDFQKYMYKNFNV